MIFQDPLTAMHPYYTVGAQIIEAYRVHNKVSKAVARKRAIEMLDRVGIPQPAERVDDYPHQFSGGMRQRAMIAMSLVCNPELLIADEPTTALDVTVQAQILDLIRDLQEEFHSAVIMITHDLGVVAELADDILVMYGGKCIEYGSAVDLFRHPEHPYTWGLLGSMPRVDREVRERLIPIPGTPPSLINLPDGCSFHPRCACAGPRRHPVQDGRAEARRQRQPPDRVPPAAGRPRRRSSTRRSRRRCKRQTDCTSKSPPRSTPCRRAPHLAPTAAGKSTENLLEVTGLQKHFPITRGAFFKRKVGAVRAVDGIDFAVRAGETLGLVGESGCGKSTTGRLVTRLLEPTGGKVSFEGRDITHLSVRRDAAAAARRPDDLPGPVLVAEPAAHGRLDRRRRRCRCRTCRRRRASSGPCRICWRSSV